MPDAKTNQDDLALLEKFGREAGAIALSYFGKDPEVWWKEGNSPVSQADFEVDTFLKENLMSARPDYGWLSEETEDDDTRQVDRLEAKRVFVVDPIDGTRGFINGLDRWCVSIAIVEDNRPVAAVLFAPVLNQMLSACLGGGLLRDGASISVRPVRETLTMTGPRWFLESDKPFADRSVEKTPFVPSLAWRIAMVAMGEIDVALARGSARDWDLAAADLIVHEGGGRLTDMQSGLLSYNCPSTRQGSLVASGASHHNEMLDLARSAMNKQPKANG